MDEGSKVKHTNSSWVLVAAVTKPWPADSSSSSEPNAGDEMREVGE